MQHRGAVPLRQGIEYVSVPDIQTELGRKLQKNKQNETNGQWPGKTPRALCPELLCGGPEAPRECAPRWYFV